MAIRYLLDTNVVPAIARQDPAALSKLAQAQVTYLSSIVVAGQAEAG